MSNTISIINAVESVNKEVTISGNTPVGYTKEEIRNIKLKRISAYTYK